MPEQREHEFYETKREYKSRGAAINRRYLREEIIKETNTTWEVIKESTLLKEKTRDPQNFFFQVCMNVPGDSESNVNHKKQI